jgi:hypothetical protein
MRLRGAGGGEGAVGAGFGCRGVSHGFGATAAPLAADAGAHRSRAAPRPGRPARARDRGDLQRLEYVLRKGEYDARGAHGRELSSAGELAEADGVDDVHERLAERHDERRAHEGQHALARLGGAGARWGGEEGQGAGGEGARGGRAHSGRRRRARRRPKPGPAGRRRCPGVHPPRRRTSRRHSSRAASSSSPPGSGSAAAALPAAARGAARARRGRRRSRKGSGMAGPMHDRECGRGCARGCAPAPENAGAIARAGLGPPPMSGTLGREVLVPFGSGRAGGDAADQRGGGLLVARGERRCGRSEDRAEDASCPTRRAAPGDGAPPGGAARRRGGRACGPRGGWPARGAGARTAIPNPPSPPGCSLPPRAPPCVHAALPPGHRIDRVDPWGGLSTRMSDRAYER